MLRYLISILSAVLEVITAYTGLTALGCLVPRKKKPEVPPRTHFGVLIAARNEEAVLPTLVESLWRQNYPRELYDIIVIPNNCTDNTEAVAHSAGAKILFCTGPVKTKGEVLHQAFAQLAGRYDAYVVFDADNVVHPDFLLHMNHAVAAGAQVAKSRQCALNPYDNWVSGCYDLYFQNINLLHSRARAPFSLSAKLIGTGFLVTDALLQRLGGWNTVTLTEDMEFAAQCALADEAVHYVPEALTYDEEPLSFRVSLRQRRRWSAGMQQVAFRYAPKLIRKRPSWLRWDLAAHVSMIPVQLLALIPLLYECFCTPLPELGGALAVSAVSFWLGSTAMAVFLAISAKRSLVKMWGALLLYPLFLASWYPLHLWALVSKPKTWKPIVHGTAKSRREKVSAK